ncbi:MAG: hypothetical protein AAGB46_01855 [Verrucomicrobiota bacterium]
MKGASKRKTHDWRAMPGLLLIGLAAGCLSGCAAIPLSEQGLAAKRNMSFGGSLGESLDSSVASQIEPGADSSGGAQAAGCIACR